jgi:hypothetical protein
MRKSASLSGSAAILVVSVLTIAVTGALQIFPTPVANAGDLRPSTELGTTTTSGDGVQVRVSEAYGRLPLHFEANQGQTDSQVKFLSRSSKHTLFLTSSEAVLVFLKTERQAKDGLPVPKAKTQGLGTVTGTALRMIFIDANSDPLVTGREELPGKANYFIGNDPAQWRTNVPTYTKVRYEDLYPGIDLVYYGNQRQLEYDFVLRPGADPRRIALGFQGTDRLEVDAQGHLVLHTPTGTVRQQKPVIYQEIEGLRQEVAGGYVLKNAYQVGIHVGAYDTSRPLIIDPVLFYSTYLGGSGDDEGTSIAVDAAGNAYVTGTTDSINFPTVAGSFDTGFGGGSLDVFVTKLNPTGSGLVYSTYLGGSASEDTRTGGQIAVDAAGNVYVAGATSSSNFPTTIGAFQSALAGGGDAFVTKLDPSGSALLYSTYLGGSSDDGAFGIAVDGAGSAYVAGSTNSSNFPTTAGAFQTAKVNFQDGFITKLNPAGSALVYSTYLRGTNGIFGLAIDAGGSAYVTGGTPLTNLPTTLGAFQPAHGGGGDDSFVVKLNPTGSGLVYATYLGGSGNDGADGIAVDAAGNVYVSGGTTSSNFPTTLGAFQTSNAGGTDAFVTKLNPFGSGLLYSTYLGGSANDQANAVALDPMGNAHVTGGTSSTNFPTTVGAFQTSNAGSLDAFVTKLNPFGSGLVYSTYLGGSGTDLGSGIALDTLPNPNAHVTGSTDSVNFPTTTGAFDTTFNGGRFDAYVAKITDDVLPPGPTAGKVTGGGSINVPGGIGTFGFVVQRQVSDGSIHGQLQYVNHATRDKVHSVMFDSFVVASNTAAFTGTCTINQMPCTFTVQVQDNGEPGTNDAFTISVDFAPADGGTLRSGNIQIHD